MSRRSSIEIARSRLAACRAPGVAARACPRLLALARVCGVGEQFPGLRELIEELAADGTGAAQHRDRNLGVRERESGVRGPQSLQSVP